MQAEPRALSAPILWKARPPKGRQVSLEQAKVNGWAPFSLGGGFAATWCPIATPETPSIREAAFFKKGACLFD